MRHVVAGAGTGRAAALVIARYGDADGFYLDRTGNVVTDTLHESLEAALDRPGFEDRGLSWVEPA